MTCVTVRLILCAGKSQPNAFTCNRDRDLNLDRDAIREWGAEAVVSLTEAHELKSPQLMGPGAKVRERRMALYHWPIRDGSMPTAESEREWQRAGPELRWSNE